MPKNAGKTFSKLLELCTILRSKNGCMWDCEQTHTTLIPYLIEESEEVKDAIEQNNPDNLCEELGDLLYQVVFHSQIAMENGEFTMQDVVQGIIDKLKRRHPHVFDGKKVNSVKDIIDNWEKIKKQEKKGS